MCHALQEGELLVGWFLQPSCAAEQGGCGRSKDLLLLGARGDILKGLQLSTALCCCWGRLCPSEAQAG